MGLFYAYLDDKDDQHRYLITFINRETADEWWRVLSTPPSPYFGFVERNSPQVYVQDSNQVNVSYFLHSQGFPAAKQFLGKMFFNPISARGHINPTTIAPTEVTDHISGRWYFIRCKADPFSHWYLRTRGTCAVCGDADCNAIHASSEYRTRFCVRVRNPPEDSRVSEDFVLIGRDEISITAPKGYILHIDDAGDLKATKGYQGGTDFVFDDLKRRFISRAERQVNGEVWEYIESVEGGEGESWELVD